MSKYRKVIVAIVGALVLILSEKAGLEQLVGMEDEIVNAIITLLTAAGVWAVPNSPPPKSLAKEAAQEVLDQLKAGK